MIAEVSLAAALLCFADECHPVLVGKQTLPGGYLLRHQPTKQRGYGGDVLVYHETADSWYAIHRTYPGRERLYSAPPAARRVTSGCINVEPALYDRLVSANVLYLRIKP